MGAETFVLRVIYFGIVICQLHTTQIEAHVHAALHLCLISRESAAKIPAIHLMSNTRS